MPHAVMTGASSGIGAALARELAGAGCRSSGMTWCSAGKPGEAKRVRRVDERRQARVVYSRIYRAARWFPALTRWLMDRLTP